MQLEALKMKTSLFSALQTVLTARCTHVLEGLSK